MKERAPKKTRRPAQFAVLVLAVFLYFSAPGLATGLSVPASILAALLLLPLAWYLALMFSDQNAVSLWRPARGILLFQIGLTLLYSAAAIPTIMTSDEAYVPVAATNLALLFVLIAPALLAIIGCLSSFSAERRYQLLIDATCRALTMLLLVQLLLPLIGIQHAQIDTIPQVRDYALVFGLMGVEVHRFLMPIASGMHNALVVPMLLGGLAFSRFCYQRSWGAFLMFSLAMVVLLLVDSRTAVAALPIGIVFYFVLRRQSQIAAWTAGLLPTLLFTSLALRDWLPGLVDLASGRYDTAGAFSGRELIWSAFWNYVGKAEISQLLFGNGVYGQQSSGVSLGYNYLFSSFSDAAQDLATLHNSYLQIWADIGLLGVSLYIIGITSIARQLIRLERAANGNGALWRGILIFVFSMQFTASSEVTLTPYSKEGMLSLVFVWTIVSFFGGSAAPRFRQAPFTPVDNQVNRARSIRS